MRLTVSLLMSLALGTLGLDRIHPGIASAEGRAPLRVTASDIDVARHTLTDLLARSNLASQRFVDMPGPDEQARAGLGAPLPVAMIRLDRLRAYQLGAPLDDLIDHLNVVLYPVQVDQDVRGEIELVRQGSSWQAVRVGASGHAREVARMAKLRGTPAFLLRVPALGVEFLAYRSGDALIVVLVHVTPGVELQAGRPLPVQEALRVLVPLARAYRDDLLRKP
ncbi:MAG TPA: hypothetical protein VFK02_07165 [Kofleriaceae bacterium]|nr:hypothetical protein [Kofleriaceae bacterium]